MEMFAVFKNNSKWFVVNQSHSLAKKISQSPDHDFSIDEKVPAKYVAKNFKQSGLNIQFSILNIQFSINAIGAHNMENATAAAAVANQVGVDLNVSADALRSYEGIYRRNQVYGNKNGVWLVDDYAHNPVKCAAAIKACQPVAPKVVAWFQPHGFAPTKFLRNDYVEEIAKALRPSDEIWMSEIFYAGGTTTKDISANDLINGISTKGTNAFFVENRNDLVKAVRSRLTDNCVLLLMGARDPSLEQFAKQVWSEL
jgi:UDP-N-acetylmuramate--alanine ligase